MAWQWLSTAAPDDLARAAKFHIPLSLVNSIPPDHMPDFRYRVVVHQYGCMQLAGELRHNLPMPQDPVEERRSSSGGTAIWYTAFRRRAQYLPPTEERLVRQCHYNPRKRSAAGSQQRSAKPKRDHRLETRRTVAKLLRQPYTVPRACMIIRALPVLTWAHLCGDFPRHRHALDTVCDPCKTVATSYGGNLHGGQQPDADGPITDQGNCLGNPGAMAGHCQSGSDVGHPRGHLCQGARRVRPAHTVLVPP